MGGMEAHAATLCAEMVRRGHDVTLLASGDSAVPCRVHPVLAEHYDRAFPWHDFHGTDALNDHLDRAFAVAARDLLAGGFDVVHNNSLHRYPPRLALARRLPTVTSLHVPPFDALRRAVHDSPAPWHAITATSRRHLAQWWARGAPPQAHVVANGIDPAAWPFVPRGDGSAAWIGRITPNKGTHLAAQAARIAGIPLTIYGTVEHRDYYEDKVRPLLGGDVRHAGHLSGGDLARAVGQASVLLFTPLWDEPFGLAAIEAMACGLPVVAIERGAVREVIGPCGVYCDDDPSELAGALPEAMRIPRTRPRDRVLRLFTVDRMADGYEALYACVIAGRGASAAPVEFPAIELTVAD